MLLMICELAVHFCVAVSSQKSDITIINRQPLGLQMCIKLCSMYGRCPSHTFDPVQLRCALEIVTDKHSSCHDVNLTTEVCATSTRCSRTIHPRKKGLRSITQTLKVSRNKNANNKGVAQKKNAGKISAAGNKKANRKGETRNKNSNKKDAKPSYKGHKKNSCIEKDCKASDTSMSKDKDCILLLRENFTIGSQKELITLPLAVKPGMKISVYGRYVPGTSYSQLSFSKDPKHIINMFEWVNVFATWSQNVIAIAEGFSRTDCKGSFPISDPRHFNLTVKLSLSSTKIYADQALVWTMKAIPFIKELCLRRYDKVYRMVVQKTEDGCDEVDNGIP